MKKIITFLLALSFCIIFSACGGSAPETSEEVMSTPAQIQNGPSSGEDVSYNDVIFNELKIKIPALCIKNDESSENDVSYFFPNTSGESGALMMSYSNHDYGDPVSNSESIAFSTFLFWKNMSDDNSYTISDIEKLNLQNVYAEKATFTWVSNNDSAKEGEMYIFFTPNYRYSIMLGWEENKQPDLMRQSIQEIVGSISFDVSSTSEPVETATAAETKTEYNIGETWTVDGQWSLTITGVQATTDRNRYSDKEPAAVYIVDYTYENLGYEGSEFMPGLYINLEMGTIIDRTKKLGYSYPGRTSKNPSEIPVGVSCDAQSCVGVDNAGSFSIMISKYDWNNQRQEATFNLAVD